MEIEWGGYKFALPFFLELQHPIASKPAWKIEFQVEQMTGEIEKC